MADESLQDRVTALHTALHGPAAAAGNLPQLEDLKRWLDDTRLRLWGKMQAAHAPSVAEFEERFRVKRATELCTRLTADLKSHLMHPDLPEYSDLWIAVTELAQAVQASRARPAGG